MSDEREPSELFRERLRAARDMRGWNQGELAGAAKMPQTSIAHLESGSRKPSFDTLRRLAEALEVTTDYLLGRTDEPSLAQSADPLYRDVGKLNAHDRQLAKDFLDMLTKRNKDKP
jgi:transcriptional regulator with XRE-family HTH domain